MNSAFPITHAVNGVPAQPSAIMASRDRPRITRQRVRRGTDLPLAAIADRSSRLVPESADDRRENGTCHATTGDLADDAADIRR